MINGDEYPFMKSWVAQISRPDAASTATTPRPLPPASVMIELPNATGLDEYPHGFAAPLAAGTSGRFHCF